MALVPAVPATISAFEEEEDDGKSPLQAVHCMKECLAKEGPNSIKGKFRRNEVRRFLLAEINKDTECVAIKHVNRPTNCRCISSITNVYEHEAVLAIDNLYGYALLPKGEQQTLVKEWIKYAERISNAYSRADERKRASFLLPGTKYLICKDALCRLLGIGKASWATISKMAKNNMPSSHGLVGRAGHKQDDTMETLLNGYFKDLLPLATPRATLIIRSLVRDLSSSHCT
jgi:hypothetical protein